MALSYVATSVIVAVLGLILYTKYSPFTGEAMDPNVEAKHLFESFWTWRLKDSPEFATFTGNHSYDHQLQSYSLDSFKERKKACKEFFTVASNLLSANGLNNETKLNLELLIADLSIYLKGMDAKGYLFPVNYLEGVHLEFERLISAMSCNSVEDYKKIISRFTALPKQVTEIIELMREAIKMNMTFHSVSMKGVLGQLDQLMTKPVKTDFYKPFLSIPETIPSAKKILLQHEAEKVIASDVLSSFKKLKDFLANEYFNSLRAETSVSSLRNGQEFYQLCLTLHLGFHITPQEVHDMGLREVARISEEMGKVVKSLDLKMSVKDFSNRLKDDDDLYFTSHADLLEAYNGLVFNKIEPKLHQIIKNIPKSKLVIEPMPPSMSSGPAAYYLAGTFDGSRPGVFYVNIGSLKSSPKYEMMTLALHEAVPGHHLQISYMMEQENVPDFRRHIEDRKYSDAPSRFPLHTAYIEGWGLYSEYLGYELDLYDDPYFHYGHLSFEMFRACRLVVDTGIHALGWSREQAVDYMLNNTASHKLHIENEINRYITWPGQACAYKVGELKIKEIREKAEKALGSQFNVQEFHDVVLRSAGPLSLLEQKVAEFIQQSGG